MMEPQRYPEVRLQPGRDILRPYDVATWTLPLQMGVRVERAHDARGHDARHGDQAGDEGSDRARRRSSRASRSVATYKPWQASMDEGWTRWLLDTYGVPVTGLSPQEVQKGLDRLRRGDPPRHPQRDHRHRPPHVGRRAMRYEEEMPPEYRGGPRHARRRCAAQVRRRRRHADRVRRLLRVRDRRVQRPGAQRARAA